MEPFLLRFVRSPILLRAAQWYLFLIGVVLVGVFFMTVIWPTIRSNIPGAQYKDFSEFIGISGTILIIDFILFIIIGFLRINIRSKAEQEEERVRREVSRIDSELRGIDFNINVIGADGEEREELENRYNELEKERNLLISRGSQVLERAVSTDWGITLVESRKRLLKEEQRLIARNVANLTYGVLAAIIGVSSFLIAFVVSYSDGTLENLSLVNFPFYYLLCIPITIISEVVAIFFLRLFAQTERSIERNKNEMTNIELRLTAIQLPHSNKDRFDSLADTLSKEERNFVLKKNETSTITDIDKLDIDRAVEIATKIIKATK